MKDLKKLQSDISAFQIALNKLKEEYNIATIDNLKEQFGNNINCGTCAYSCCVSLDDYHTSCMQGKCIHCNNLCASYLPENKLSNYLNTHHHYYPEIIDALDTLFDTIDIIKDSNLHEAALEILRIAKNAKEKSDE